MDKVQATELLYRFLEVSSAPVQGPVDLVLGFGHFDLRIARHAAALALQSAPSAALAFTGGIGAGTADLGRPEAEAFRDEVRPLLGEALLSRLIVENRSTNTGENVRFVDPLLRQALPALFAPQRRPRIALVATGQRMRRVLLTARVQWPLAELLVSPPASDIATEEALYASKGLSMVAGMLGELKRLRDYPSKGWCVAEPIPAHIEEAERILS